ncbi:MAG TPA: amino acid adenylation domain-containing protein, partial [Polyangiaceae bacterium]
LDYVAPRTATEQLIAGIWSAVLGVENVGLDDNFFHLGGHSLLATQAISRIRAALHTELPLRALFETPTVAGLAAAVEALRHGRGSPGSESAAPIPRVARDAPLALSYAQERLWFLDQLEPGDPSYVIALATELRGAVDVEALRRAVEEVIHRHEALRTTFPSDDGQPRQAIQAPPAWELPLLDLSARSDVETEVRRLAAEDARRPFELARGQLIRTTLLRTAACEHVLLLAMHHVVSDGWSMGVFARELGELYGAFARGAPSPLEPLPLQYADFAAWQRAWLGGGELARQLDYWKTQLAGVPFLDVPTDRPHLPERSGRGAEHRFRISAACADALRAFSRREGVTLFMALVAAFDAFLARYSGQDDIAVGTPIANRTRRETESLIGFFVNTLVLRTDLSGDPSFRVLVERVKRVALDAYAHQDAPFEKVVEEVAPARDLSRTPLFQVMFALATPGREAAWTGLEATPLARNETTSPFDLILDVVEHEEGALGAAFTYSADLFDAATIARMSEHFCALVEAATEAPDASVRSLPMMREAERRRVVHEWNETSAAFPREARVHELFEAQARRTPGAVAVEAGERRWTYAELDARAEALAGRIRGAGGGEGARVALAVERSPEMLAGVLGILKAGAAYVPIDPALPPERRAWMLDDAQVQCVVTPDSDGWFGERARVVNLNVSGSELERAASGARSSAQRAPSREAPAYLLYTSGSTGRAKGVLVSHRNVVNHATAMLRRFALTASDRVLQFATISFDAAAEEIFPTLAAGATLVLRDDDISHAALERLRPTVLNLPTAFWHGWVAEMAEAGARVPASVRLVIVGGEAAQRDRLEAWKALGGDRTLWLNTYGPTEATVSATAYAIPPGASFAGASIPIGAPIENVQAYVVDARGAPAPIGVPGELWLGGEGIALGYFARPELTAERFVENPFGAGRLYRTGDRVRWRGDGLLEFLGRIDLQVKVRGYRIEPGEIEAALRQHESVRDAACVARVVGGDHRLVAYVVPRAMPEQAGRGALLDAARAHLREKLPAYMVPANLVLLEALPMTPNKKVDLRALPAPEAEGSGGGAVLGPRDALELRLVSIWEEILGRAPIGVDEGFFELGGHSLLAVRLMARIRRELGRDLPLATLFVDGTVAGLARRLRGGGDGPSACLVPIQPQGRARPLFAVHPAGGNVLCFAPLGRALGRERPLYALQAAGLNSSEPDRTVEAMASRYVAEVRARQPRGPYHLAGYSLGAAIAHAMASQLLAAGESMASLTLLDAWAPAPRLAGETSSALLDFAREHRLATTDADLDALDAELRGLDDDGALALVLRKARDAGAVPPDVDLPTLRRLLGVMTANIDAVHAYRPQLLSLPNVSLVRAVQSPRDPDEARGWRDIAGEVAIHDAPGDHATMLMEPNVAAVASIFAASAARSE